MKKEQERETQEMARQGETRVLHQSQAVGAQSLLAWRELQSAEDLHP